MTPEQLAHFASVATILLPEQIDRIHRVLLRLQEDARPINAETVAEKWFSFAHKEEDDDESPLELIEGLLEVDPSVPLPAKFLDVLDEAHIVLSTASPESVKSIDSNDPLWLQAVAIDNHRLATQAIDLWRKTMYDARDALLDDTVEGHNAQADMLYKKRLVVRAIMLWRRHMARIKELEATADAFRRRRDIAFVMRTWTLAERESIFRRELSYRAAHKFLCIWRQKLAVIRAREAAADSFRDRHVVQNVLRRMAEKHNDIQRAESQALLVYEGNLAHKAFAMWYAKLEKNQENERKADAAADYHAGKHAFQMMRARAQRRLLERQIVEARTHILSFKYVRKWRKFTKKSKEAKYNAAYKTIRRRTKVNIGRTVIELWLQKTRHNQWMRARADAFRAQKDEESAQHMAHKAIVTMYNRTEQLQVAKTTADQFYTRHLVDRLQIFGDNWLGNTRQILENQRIADNYRATRTESYAVGVIRDWNNAAFRAKRLEEDAEALKARNERKRNVTLLQRWRSAAASRADDGGEAMESLLVPATPAARRSQLLASTTPAYTPATGLFDKSGGLVEENDEDDDE